MFWRALIFVSVLPSALGSGYEFAWTSQGSATQQAKSMIEVLRNAAAKGLDPEDYDGSRWTDRLAALDASRRPASESDLARFDLALTISVMRYISDLHSGRVNPGLFHGDFDLEGGEHNLARFVRERLIAGTDLRAALESIEPRYPGYWRTQQALQRYAILAREEYKGDALPIPKKTVEPGGSYAGVRQLTNVLRRLGDLQVNAPLPAGANAYAEPLVSAVKHFQARHGLEPDGRLGKATAAQLNVPVSHRVRQLSLALERWRWMPCRLSQPTIVVNIPEFRLRVLNQAYEAGLDMKVIVGKAGRNRTPLLAAEMTFVIFRPYWEVPQSILREELMPRIAKDPLYLAHHDYEVVSEKGALSGANVNEDVVAALRQGRLRVRQVPGAENALGLVKFMFPNPYNVYMHDTPTTGLFAKFRRDFSHGCIRVEKPAELAAWVLRDKPEWTPGRIVEAMNGSDNVRVILDRPIPVLTVYQTVVVPKSGDVHFLPDIYGEDAKLERLLATSAARGRYPRE